MPQPQDGGATQARPRRAAVYDGIVDGLVAYISEHDLQPGERLPAERVLAQRLGASRTSVRQALTVLRLSGIVEVRRGVGVYVKRPAHDNVASIAADLLAAHPDALGVTDVHEALESHAAGLAACRRSDADLAELALANDQMGREIEAGQTGLDGDRRFHRAVIAAAGSPVIDVLLAQISEVVERVACTSLTRPGQPGRSLLAHRLIFEAIVRSDRGEAARLMLDHLQTGPA